MAKPAKEWKCTSCQGKRSYSEPYDAYFCSVCDLWLEDACDDPRCSYCHTRPQKPSLAKFHTFPPEDEENENEATNDETRSGFASGTAFDFLNGPQEDTYTSDDGFDPNEMPEQEI